MKTARHFWSYLAQFFFGWEMFVTKFVEEIKTHVLCAVTPPPHRKSCRLWDNVEKYCRGAGHRWTISRMCIACWISKATHTLTICNTYCFSTATIVARARLIVTFYVHCLVECLILHLMLLWDVAPLHIPEEWKRKRHHCESLKSRVFVF